MTRDPSEHLRMTGWSFPSGPIRASISDSVLPRHDPDVPIPHRVPMVLQPDSPARGDFPRPARQRAFELDVVVDLFAVPVDGDAGVGRLLAGGVELGRGELDVVG